jgi:organic hydroperoxide reductase OsmC/OhrA
MTTVSEPAARKVKPLPHEYETRLIASNSEHATVSAAGVPDLRMAPPAEYGGPGDAWTPEHLLLASVQACFLFTFRAIARISKVEYSNIEVDASGIVDRQDHVTRFTEIVLRPRMRVPVGSDVERLRHVIARVETQCLVSSSLSTPVRVEPEILEA